MKRLLVLCFAIIVTVPFFAQESPFDQKLKQALTLYELGRSTEALPLFEDLAKQQPQNIVVLEHYAMTLLMSDALASDPIERKRIRVEARRLFLKARELGSKSSLAGLGDDIPEDGSFSPFSDRREVDDAIKAGEVEYAKGNYDAAIAHYQKALVLDPKNYSAALYIGDVLYKQNKHDEAGRWFSQAIAIDPNLETAYRYWGDSLASQGKWEEAKPKFIEAIVAEPYSRRAWTGLSQWADARGMKLVKPNIVPRSKVEEKDEKNVRITLDLGEGDKKDGTAAWVIYPMIQVSWKTQGKFLKEHPGEKQYRRSLDEEMEALTAVLESVDIQLKEKRVKHLDPQLQKLLELREHGFLEPYILLHRADAGIAQDYPAYRDAHRQKVAEYVASCTVPK